MKYIKLFGACIIGGIGIAVMIVSAAITIVGLAGLWTTEATVNGMFAYIEEQNERNNQ